MRQTVDKRHIAQIAMSKNPSKISWILIRMRMTKLWQNLITQ